MRKITLITGTTREIARALMLFLGKMATEQIKGLIIILGSPNSMRGKLYNIAKERCELALTEYFKRPGWKLLLTGGYGAHFNTSRQPHAAYLRRYLLKRKIPSQNIVELAESSNTVEDAYYSKLIALKYGVSEILVVISDYHEDRACYVFEREFADAEIHIEFLIARTDEKACHLDLEDLREHERIALAKLREEDKKK